MTSLHPSNHVGLELEKQLRASQDLVSQLQNERNQLQNELNSLHESQFSVTTKRDAVYEQRVAGMQQSLLKTEQRLQMVERQLGQSEQERKELVEKHAQELEERDQRHAWILSEHERNHAELLEERDRRHGEKIASMTEELRNHVVVKQQEPAISDLDPTEQEAKRLRMIKEKMVEMHNLEKERMASEHAQEKECIRGDYVRQMEEYRMQATEAANAQLKTIHTQYTEAFNMQKKELEKTIQGLSDELNKVRKSFEISQEEKATMEQEYSVMEEQKKGLEKTIQSLRDELNRLRRSFEISQEEKTTLEQDYQSLLDSHEIEKQNSVTLETKMRKWEEGASRLEARLNSSNSSLDSQDAEPEVLREKEEAVLRATAQYKKIIAMLESQVWGELGMSN